MMNGDMKVLGSTKVMKFTFGGWVLVPIRPTHLDALHQVWGFCLRSEKTSPHILREPSLVAAAWLPLVGGGPWYLVFDWLFSLIWWGVITYPRISWYLYWNFQIIIGEKKKKTIIRSFSFCNFRLGWIHDHFPYMNKAMKHSYSWPHC